MAKHAERPPTRGEQAIEAFQESGSAPARRLQRSAQRGAKPIGAPVIEFKALNAKQAMFVLEYQLDLNATQAAIRAGYSKKTAQEQGSRLLSKAMVKAAVAEAQAARATALEVTIERLVPGVKYFCERRFDCLRARHSPDACHEGNRARYRPSIRAV